MSNQTQPLFGPWTVDEDLRVDGAHQVVDESNMTICFVAVSGDAELDLACAYMLAASSDLYEALKMARTRIIELQDFLHWQDELPGQRHIEPEWLANVIDAALAKARGEVSDG